MANRTIFQLARCLFFFFLILKIFEKVIFSYKVKKSLDKRPTQTHPGSHTRQVPSSTHQKINIPSSEQFNCSQSDKTDPTMDKIINNPGSIQINSTGAFIIENEASKDSSRSTNGIALPYHTTEISHIAIDIGGSLAKIVYFTSNSSKNGSNESVSSQGSCGSSASSASSQSQLFDGGRLNFFKIETAKIDEFINFIRDIIKSYDDSSSSGSSSTKQIHIMATGGGSVKFYDYLKQELNLGITKKDEMECLIVGLDFLINEIPNEIFIYSDSNPMQFINKKTENSDKYPYLLVNIGSGVSMIKVTGPLKFERVGGSSLGGGTLWGLLSLLTNAESYDEMLSEAAMGDNHNVDMLVGDIYGTDYNKIGLKSTAIASSFGKVFQRNSSNVKPTFNSNDISKSLLYAISNNIGQIAYLQAKIHNIKNIYFGGSYIRNHSMTMKTLSFAINFWSQGEKTAYFLRHEGYLGAIGAFLKMKPKGWGRKFV